MLPSVHGLRVPARWMCVRSSLRLLSKRGIRPSTMRWQMVLSRGCDCPTFTTGSFACAEMWRNTRPLATDSPTKTTAGAAHWRKRSAASMPGERWVR